MARDPALVRDHDQCVSDFFEREQSLGDPRDQERVFGFEQIAPFHPFPGGIREIRVSIDRVISIEKDRRARGLIEDGLLIRNAHDQGYA